ncbi:Iron-containing redox enzyme [Microlunatus sagamiharensis]|uniref:Iron-containing redox enzyme n=1 Tax=Microlunatus sagamiharensis TaxID=546874 RepID=A0A1H2M9B2_9ACTN|nr:iron-containing redox enzyme family protein [Microlunatus sagamiharensis]SDU89511.1 Iron-containing redox enzyme [Microlunatus sagamiharensis]
MTIDTAVASPALHDDPAPLPQPRGPLTAALLAALVRDPHRSLDLRHLLWSGEPATALADEDLQLALWLAYELHYRGLAGVDEGWEWHPELLWARARWEDQLLAGLELAVPHPTDLGVDDVVRELVALADADGGPSLAKHLMRDADVEQLREFLVHRSIYHLKEADPHSWGIPRLSGRVKGALITIQADEYGGGVPAGMHAQLFRTLMQDWGVDSAYGSHVDHVPGLTLLGTNVMSLFGLHRRWRGALVGHLTAIEMSSSTPNARYARGHRRLGGGEAAARFFDEHVVADAVHEQIALHDLAAGFARVEPAFAGDVVFGARCAAHTDALLAEHVIAAWEAGRSSLRTAEVAA